MAGRSRRARWTGQAVLRAAVRTARPSALLARPARRRAGLLTGSLPGLMTTPLAEVIGQLCNCLMNLGVHEGSTRFRFLTLNGWRLGAKDLHGAPDDVDRAGNPDHGSRDQGTDDDPAPSASAHFLPLSFDISRSPSR